MYLVVGLQGHVLSCCPGSKGAPEECRHLTNSPLSLNASMALAPTRVMMCMFTTTYSLSVICTPILESGDPKGPMQKGMTYMVLPFMLPFNKPFSIVFISAGSIQLLVGPAS